MHSTQPFVGLVKEELDIIDINTIRKQHDEKKSMRCASQLPRVRPNVGPLTWGGNRFSSSWNSSAHSPHGYRRDVKWK